MTQLTPAPPRRASLLPEPITRLNGGAVLALTDLPEVAELKKEFFRLDAEFEKLKADRAAGNCDIARYFKVNKMKCDLARKIFAAKNPEPK
jgi:hypothetical protein